LAITFTRRLAHQLRNVFRRAFGSRGPGSAVCFTASADTLSVRAATADIAVEYRGPGGGSAETLWLPFQALDDCEAKKDDAVQLEAEGEGRVTAHWRDGSVPQIVQYDTVPPRGADRFPGLPETFAENPPRLRQALVDAGDSTDPDSARYAVDHLQLRGLQGTISATDGRQLLVQSGFTFPWEGDLLIPCSRVFASPELARDNPILVGKVGDWVAFRAGGWTIWLAVNKDGRFPDVERHIPKPRDAVARCQFSEAR